MRSGTHLLKAARVSPLRQFSMMPRKNNLLTTHHHNNPDRGLFTETAWGVAGLASAHRVLDVLTQDYYYNHPWPAFVILAAVSSLVKAAYEPSRIETQFISSIFDAKASNTLLAYFKHNLSNDDITSRNLFLLVSAAFKTNTLETLLDSAKDLDPKNLRKLFDAVKDNGTLDQCNYFLDIAKSRGVSVAMENTLSMRPRM